MVEKKKAQAKKDAEEAKANEAIRRKGGHDAAQIKADLALKEAEKNARERARDKLEDAKAKDRVRQQIAADKQARLDRAKKEKALREGGPVDVGAAAAGGGGSGQAERKPAAAAAASTAATTRLQIRVPGSGPVVWSGPSETALGEVEVWLRAQPAGQALGAVVFSSTYPRKTFGQGDLVNTLQALGLAPSVSGCTSLELTLRVEVGVGLRRADTALGIRCGAGCVDGGLSSSKRACGVQCTNGAERTSDGEE